MLKLHEELTIGAMGAKGDGVARKDHRHVHVPYTLPGETIIATVDGERGEVNEIVVASPDRIAPFCAWFGRCGGCALQHWAPEPYEAWKRGLLTSALEQQDVQAPCAPLVNAQGQGRRRVVFHARKLNGRVEVGFMARRTHDLVAIDQCPILVPALARAPELAQHIAQIVDTDKPLDIHLTATESGIDCDLRGLGEASDRQRRRLVENMAAFGLVRLSVHGALIAMRSEPRLAMGRAEIALPSGTFLQATAEGEAVLTALAAEMIGGGKKIADLFCGVGPFSLRLAEHASVSAYDSDERAVRALAAAAARTEGLKPVKAETRDLFRVPLVPQELNAFSAVLLDPPRAGARAQMAEIAKSDVPRVVSVACDVQSFARDAKILIDAGYRCERVVPVDQFRWSPHLEMIGLFTKAVAHPRKRRLLG